LKDIRLHSTTLPMERADLFFRRAAPAKQYWLTITEGEKYV
jgi:hypothetical protein